MQIDDKYEELTQENPDDGESEASIVNVFAKIKK